MKQVLPVILSCWCITHTFAQINIVESFDDTTWAAKNKWQGQLNDFAVNVNNELQSIGHPSGQSTLFLPYSLRTTMQWQLDIRLQFAPSETNNLKIYLWTEDTSIHNNRSYYLDIGESGNLDAIRLYKQDSSKTTLLAAGTSGLVANDPVNLTLKVIYRPDGVWQLYVKSPMDSTFIEEWTVTTVPLPIHSAWFGIQCRYTSTRKDKFIFDNIHLTDQLSDVSPPRIVNILSDTTSVILFFNEAVDLKTALDEENYVLSGDLHQPWKVKALNDSTIHLFLTKEIKPGKYDIICKTIWDRNGNQASNLRGSWEHKISTVILPSELMLTEIMIDPTPTVGLPPFEFIEIYNNTNKNISLAGAKLFFENTSYLIDGTTDLVLQPEEYGILCEQFTDTAFIKFGKVIPMKKWPTLRNTNGLITLRDAQNQLVHQVVYDDNMYQDTQKDDGGWSLEMINIQNTCDGRLNWKASNHQQGGTPGRLNSVSDFTWSVPLLIDSLHILHSREIIVYTNKSSKDHQIRFVPDIRLQEIKTDSLHRIVIKLDNELRSDTIYKILIQANDCQSRNPASVERFLALSKIPSTGDLVINEILFNPPKDGNDYVEMYNTTTSILRTKGLHISNEHNGQSRTVTTDSYILPASYFVISSDASWVFNTYNHVNKNQLITHALPAFSDDQGQVVLRSATGILLDSIFYHENYHHPLISNREGVSLERKNALAPPIASNWQSAAAVVGYGTPTQKNSNSATQTIQVHQFTIEKKLITPNQDGIDDGLRISYKLKEAGYIVQIDLFNDDGRRIHQIANNLSLSVEGQIEWNVESSGQLVPEGIYIINIQGFHLNGDRIKERLTVAIDR